MTDEEKIEAIRKWLKEHEWLDGYSEEESDGAWSVMCAIQEIIEND